MRIAAASEHESPPAQLQLSDNLRRAIHAEAQRFEPQDEEGAHVEDLGAVADTARSHGPALAPYFPRRF
jgi:hypothetical protein